MAQKEYKSVAAGSEVNDLDDSAFYTKVIAWSAASFASMAVSSAVIGPFIPQSLIAPLYLIAILALVLSSSFREEISGYKASGALAIVIPAILGAVMYPTLNYLFVNGQGGIVLSAAVGAVTIFGGMAAWGWVSKKDMTGWGSKLFFILIGLIIVSLLNVFVFQVTGLGLLISCAVLGLFAFYTFIDLQLVKKRGMGNAPAPFYALNLFLDLYNMFIALINILKFFSLFSR